jgi:hypothetical protein
LLTRAQFLEKLRATPRDWRETPGGYIRTKTGSQCPLTVATGTPWRDGPDRVNMSKEDFDAILCASDMRVDRNDPAFTTSLRKELLDACGLL